MRPLGVGFLAAGAAAQAIHIPALRSLREQFAIKYVMDVDDEVARALAELHGAAWTTDADELLASPDVDIVVIGSPDAFHARQIVKACEANKLAVLAEKPLVITHGETALIRSALEKSGTHLVVGTMHAHDEAFIEAMGRWRSLEVRTFAVDVRCYLPANDEMIALATQLIRSSTQPGLPTIAPSERSLVTAGILGVAIHDIPLVREVAPSPLRLDHARFVHPWGYFLQGTADDAVVRYVGLMGGEWKPDWSMQVFADEAVMRISFPPSFVQPGSCTVSITTKHGMWMVSNKRSGYEAEWAEVLRLVQQGGPPRYDVDRVVGDLTYALELVDQLDDAMKESVA